MSYRVDYQTVQRKHTNKKHPLRLPFLTCLCFFLFLIFVGIFWPEGAAVIKKVILPADKIIAASALNDFAHELHYGADLFEAFSEFCRSFLF